MTKIEVYYRENGKEKNVTIENVEMVTFKEIIRIAVLPDKLKT